MKNSNKSIYPFMFHQGTEDEWSNTGLTKREYFAGLAMQALMVQAIAGNHNSNNEMNNNYTAEHAVAMADALLNALSK